MNSKLSIVVILAIAAFVATAANPTTASPAAPAVSPAKHSAKRDRREEAADPIAIDSERVNPISFL